MLRFSTLLRVLKRMAPKGVERTQALLLYNKSERKFNEMQYNTEKKKLASHFYVHQHAIHMCRASTEATSMQISMPQAI